MPLNIFILLSTLILNFILKVDVRILTNKKKGEFMKTKKLFIIRERPKDIPEDWLIFNAPRPLLGDKEWTGEFQHGIFYVAVDPNGYIPESWIEKNCGLDGWLIEYISKENAMQKAKDFYHKEYPNQKEAIEDLTEHELIQTFHRIFNQEEIEF